MMIQCTSDLLFFAYSIGRGAKTGDREIHRNKHSDCSFFTAEIAGKSNKRTKGKKQ